MRLSNPIEKHGFFWLPSHPENQYPGILRISDVGEITLRINYLITTIDSNLLHSGTPIGKEPPRILGQIDDDPITLVGCKAAEDPFYPLRLVQGNVSASIFNVGWAFIGANYGEGEHITFTSVQFSVEGLSEWLTVSGFRHKFESDSGKADWRLEYRQPDDISIPLPDDIELTFAFSPSFALPDHGESGISSSITQNSHISLASTELVSFVAFSSVVHKIHTFLCFAINNIVSTKSITGYSKNKLDKWGRETPVKIFYQSQIQHPQHRQNTFTPMTFKYSDVSANLEEVIVRWIENYDKSQPAFDLYFDSKIGAHKFLNAIFLSLIQGIETFHRRNYDRTQMEHGEFRELHDKIVESVPASRREWIEGRLKYANEISLRNRLRHLIEPFQELFGISSERKSFVNKVIDLRNYWTHYDQDLEDVEKSVTTEELWELCLKLEALFQLHFLKLVGMDIEVIRSIAQKNVALQRKLGFEERGS